MAFSTVAILIAVTTQLQPQEFEAAKEKAEKNGRPLVVLIGAKWCPACNVMNQRTIQKVASDGALEHAEYSYVDYDQNREIARRMMHGNRIPQLIRLDYDNRSELIKRYNGPLRDVAAIKNFIANE